MWSIKRKKKFRRGSTRPIKYTKGPFPIIGEIIWQSDFYYHDAFFREISIYYDFTRKKLTYVGVKIIQILGEFICFIKPLLILYSTTHTSSPHLLTKNIFQSQSHTSQCTNTTTIVLSSKLFTYSVLISLLFQNLIFNSKYIFKSLLKLRILNCQLKYVGVQRHNIEIEYILFGGQIMLKWFLHQKI